MQTPYETGLQGGFRAVRHGRITAESLEQACQYELDNLDVRSENGLYVRSDQEQFLHGRIEGARKASTLK